MAYKASVVDSWPDCPGETHLGTFPTYEQAKTAAEAEIASAAEDLTDGARWLSAKVVPA
jgi:hypothetical protein